MSVVTAKQDRDALDWYVEPAWCVDALLQVERFDGYVFDPACGCGTIPMACERYGLKAVGSDIVDRQFGGVQDFLDPDVEFVGVENIICNPPYRIAPHFIVRALETASRKVAMLVQQQFPYSQGRHALFTETPLARLYFFSQRPSMPPGHLLTTGQIEAKGGSVDYLWMVWDRAHTGAPTAHWLLKPPYDPVRNGLASYDLAIAEMRKRTVVA